MATEVISSKKRFGQNSAGSTSFPLFRIYNTTNPSELQIDFLAAVDTVCW